MLKSRESFIKKQLRVEDQLSRALGSAFCPGTPGRIARGLDLPRFNCVARAVPKVHRDITEECTSPEELVTLMGPLLTKDVVPLIHSAGAVDDGDDPANTSLPTTATATT